MAQYRKKPVVIEAFLFTGTNHPEIAQWMQRNKFFGYGDPSGECPPRVFFIETLEGTMRAEAGDYIIRGVAGEFYPCKPDIFEATYEPVPAQQDEAEESAEPENAPHWPVR